jgi:hypothetical protein
MVNKLKKGSNITKRTSQPSNKAQPLKKQQKTIEEGRSMTCGKRNKAQLVAKETKHDLW